MVDTIAYSAVLVVEVRLSAHRFIPSQMLAKLSTDPGKQKVLLNWLDELDSRKG